jgi:hypothetical protein
MRPARQIGMQTTKAKRIDCPSKLIRPISKKIEVNNTTGRTKK